MFSEVQNCVKIAIFEFSGLESTFKNQFGVFGPLQYFLRVQTNKNRNSGSRNTIDGITKIRNEEEMNPYGTRLRKS